MKLPSLDADVVKKRPRTRRRSGAAQKPSGRVPHCARPVHKGRYPVHVTLRARSGLPSLRQQVILSLVRQILREQRQRGYATGFQVVQFSVQTNHLHMVIEASDGPTLEPHTRRKNPLRSGISEFAVSLAKRLNALLGLKGPIWSDRYHAHELITPREVHHALRYVLQNHRKHGVTSVESGRVDPFSSGAFFDGWKLRPRLVYDADPLIPVFARTWLLAIGWRLHGLIDVSEVPGARP